MTINDLRIKYSDVVIIRTITEIIVEGAHKIANKDAKGRTAESIKQCAEDMRNMSYKDFCNIIKAVI